MYLITWWQEYVTSPSLYFILASGWQSFTFMDHLVSCPTPSHEEEGPGDTRGVKAFLWHSPGLLASQSDYFMHIVHHNIQTVRWLKFQNGVLTSASGAYFMLKKNIQFSASCIPVCHRNWGCVLHCSDTHLKYSDTLLFTLIILSCDYEGLYGTKVPRTVVNVLADMNSYIEKINTLFYWHDCVHG